jgi:hypothetical protein
MVTTTLFAQDEKTITLKIDTPREKTYMLTVIKKEGYTVDQLVENWAKRSRIEYATLTPSLFKHMFIDRINLRHKKLASQ